MAVKSGNMRQVEVSLYPRKGGFCFFPLFCASKARGFRNFDRPYGVLEIEMERWGTRRAVPNQGTLKFKQWLSSLTTGRNISVGLWTRNARISRLQKLALIK
jgi:hypothetical protein